MPGVQNIEVTSAESGQKLLQFLERRLGRAVPRSAVMRWIRKGEVRVDKGRAKPFDRVTEGQIVRVPPYTPADEAPAEAQAPADIDIVFENADILIVNKPAGLPVQPGTGHADSVSARLKARFKDAVFTPAPVHRIDRDTTGLVLCGKTHAALRRLSDAFQTREVKKTYLAWVRGVWAEKKPVTLRDSMEKAGTPGSEKVRTGSGKEALARVWPLEVRKDMTLLAVELLTGRTHQIRVQLASRGFSLVGDRKYGDERGKGPMCLHAWKLELDGRQYTAPPPWAGPLKVEEYASGGRGA